MRIEGTDPWSCGPRSNAESSCSGGDAQSSGEPLLRAIPRKTPFQEFLARSSILTTRLFRRRSLSDSERHLVELDFRVRFERKRYLVERWP